eukprot:2773860-Ditylum_brightwellii.AAC.1
MSKAEVETIQQNHQAALVRYYTAKNMDKALKQQLVHAVNHIYTDMLRAPLLGLTNVTCWQVLKHIYNNYSRLTTAMLSQANKQLHVYFDPSLPIEAFFSQFRQGQDLATARNSPYTKDQMMNIPFDLIFSTSVHNNICKD